MRSQIFEVRLKVKFTELKILKIIKIVKYDKADEDMLDSDDDADKMKKNWFMQQQTFKLMNHHFIWL